MVTYHGQMIQLTTFEFDILNVLAEHSGEVVQRNDLYKWVKGFDWDGVDRSIDMAVSKLRKKIKDNPENPSRIKTVWGSGYLFAKDTWE